MTNVRFAPQFVTTAPVGLMVPFGPAEALITYVVSAKLAEIVLPPATFVKVYDPTAPTETPSTRTSAIVWQASGAIVKVWSLPQGTVTGPLWLICPPTPARAGHGAALMLNQARLA